MTEQQRENLKLWKGGDMITAYILIGLGGIVVGSFTTVAIQKDRQQDRERAEPVIVEPVIVDPVGDVAKNLTNLDLLVEPCSPEFIEKNSDLLCREMFCRMMTRGVDSKTSGQECEEISNVANSSKIVNHCETFLENKEECYEKYRERK
jgi:hypothetical protein